MWYVLKIGDSKIDSTDLETLHRIAQNSDKYYEIYACYKSQFPPPGYIDKSAKMNIQDIREAKKMISRGIRKDDIARRFNVTPAYITKAIRNFE
jgi:hypothetical protein